MRTTAVETTAAYAARLREKANECDFGDTLEDRILEHIIQTIDNQTLIQKCITKGWNLNQFLLEASQMEDTSLQVRDMKPYNDGRTVARIHGYGDYHPERGNGTQRREQRFYGENQRYVQRSDSYTRDVQYSCDYCGRTGYHAAGRDCPAYGKECRNCGRLNHFESVCRSKAKHNSEEMQRLSNKKQQHEKMSKQKRDYVKKTTEEEIDSSSSDDDFISHAVHHMSQIKKVKISSGMSKTVALKMNEIDVRVEPDSGADVNLMDEYQFKALLHRSEMKPALQSSQMKLSTLQNKLPVKGEFVTTLRNKTRETRAKIVVIRGHINSPPLISKETLMELGMLEIREDGSLLKANNMKIQNDTPSINTVNSSGETRNEGDNTSTGMSITATSGGNVDRTSMNMSVSDDSDGLRTERGTTDTDISRAATKHENATKTSTGSKPASRGGTENRVGRKTAESKVMTSSASASKQIRNAENQTTSGRNKHLRNNGRESRQQLRTGEQADRSRHQRHRYCRRVKRYQNRAQRNNREPAYLRDYHYWVCDCESWDKDINYTFQSVCG